jgi:hypothetical protein
MAERDSRQKNGRVGVRAPVEASGVSTASERGGVKPSVAAEGTGKIGLRGGGTRAEPKGRTKSYKES